MVLSKQGKKEKVASIKKALGQYPVIAVASLQNLPGRQFNSIKKKLRGKAQMFVARTTILTRALSEGKPEAAALAQQFSGSAAIVVTNQNPFQLFRTLKASKSKTAAKPGQIAPTDLVIPAGETNLAPGPVLTELKQAGISAKIVGPKIVIDRDTTVAKKGEVISENAAKMLSKLGIEPMEVGLNVLGAWENGTIYPASVLDIDEAKFIEELQTAYRHAINLGVNAEIANATTLPIIVSNAARKAIGLKRFLDEKKPAEAHAPAPAASAPAAEPQATATESTTTT